MFLLDDIHIGYVGAKLMVLSVVLSWKDHEEILPGKKHQKLPRPQKTNVYRAQTQTDKATVVDLDDDFCRERLVCVSLKKGQLFGTTEVFRNFKSTRCIYLEPK